MDLSKEETKVTLEALGQRYKNLRTRPQRASNSSSERADYESTIKLINITIKKILAYKEEQFPEEELESVEEIENPESDENQRDYSEFRLLLVDDDVGDRGKVRSVLKEQGFEIFDEADDGHNAIAQIKEKAKPYDLVLCDLNMPTISGLDVLKLVRQEEKFSSMPFIMLSKKGNKKQFEEAVQAGVNGYIVKPITAENLLPKIDLLLQ
ncbi:MAG: response regulator [Pseudomonadales bacterium]|nr:response regulator [Pseudomonadales bacterium]